MLKCPIYSDTALFEYIITDGLPKSLNTAILDRKSEERMTCLNLPQLQPLLKSALTSWVTVCLSAVYMPDRSLSK